MYADTLGPEGSSQGTDPVRDKLTIYGCLWEEAIDRASKSETKGSLQALLLSRRRAACVRSSSLSVDKGDWDLDIP